MRARSGNTETVLFDTWVGGRIGRPLDVDPIAWGGGLGVTGRNALWDAGPGWRDPKYTGFDKKNEGADS
ncbi:hypothetical protein WS71_23040 [Burkholderia mayonis]|uniref:Uncharacterized protein n=1 Tax=Burkholderia mayonis TaxID=1385591 RepID=A0A1B4G2F5_9BURK|nr:hypothetical protein WS71_23040 [Burkholderia mayonis]